MSETPLDALYFHLLDERDRLRKGVRGYPADLYTREMLAADAHAELVRRRMAAWSVDVDRAVHEAEKAARKAKKFALGVRGQKPGLARLSAALDVLRSRVQALREVADTDPDAEKDGPATEGKFFHAGVGHRFPAQQWRLLKALWDVGNKSSTAVGEAVYPGEEAFEGKLKKLVHDTGNKLIEFKLPYEIISPMSGHYELRRLN